jgi:hypothetical protein
MAASFSRFPSYRESRDINYAVGYVLYSNEEGRLLVMGNIQKNTGFKGLKR